MQVQVQSPLPSSIRSDRTLKRGGREGGEGSGEEGEGRGGEKREGERRGRGGEKREGERKGRGWEGELGRSTNYKNIRMTNKLPNIFQ